MSSSMISISLFLAAAPVNTPPPLPEPDQTTAQLLKDSDALEIAGELAVGPDAALPLPNQMQNQTELTPVQGDAALLPELAPDAAATTAQPAAQVQSQTEDNPVTVNENTAAAHSKDTHDTAIVVTARQSVPEDPLAKVNAQTYAIVQGLDKAIIGPVAMTYQDKVPKPVRSGLSNFLNNVREPLVFVNFLLQLKIGKAAETVGRFAVNTTAGVAGLFDVAKKKPFNLPRRSNGFADSMAYYGIKPGAFLFLPILGPTTIRDAIGGVFDGLLLPTTVGKPFNQLTYTIPTGTLSSLGERADFDDQLKKIREESNDPYTAAREYYLSHRQAEIEVLKGKRASVDSPLYDGSEAKAKTVAAEPKVAAPAQLPVSDKDNLPEPMPATAPE